MLIKKFETDLFLKDFYELDYRFNLNQYGTNDVKLFAPGEPGSGLEFLKFKGFIIELFLLRNRVLGYPVKLNQITAFDRIQPEMKVPEYGWTESDEQLEQRIFNDPLSFGSLDNLMIEVRKNLYPATWIRYDDENFAWWFFEGCDNTTFYKVHGLFQKYAAIYRFAFLEDILPGLGTRDQFTMLLPFTIVGKIHTEMHHTAEEKKLIQEVSVHLQKMEEDENDFIVHKKELKMQKNVLVEALPLRIDEQPFITKLSTRKFNQTQYSHTFDQESLKNKE